MLRDGAIVVTSHAIKSIEELLKNLFSRLLAINEVLILGHVVNRVNILNGDRAVAAPVNQLEGLVDHVFSALGQRVSQSSDELLIGDIAIAVDIVVFHEGLDLDDLREDAISGEGLRELSLVQLFVPVVVHASENHAQRANADTTSLLDLHFKLVVDAADFDVKADAVELRHLLRELQKINYKKIPLLTFKYKSYIS